MKRRAVEKVIGRMYRDSVERCGKLPGRKETRLMEKKAQGAAERAERRRGR